MPTTSQISRSSPGRCRALQQFGLDEVKAELHKVNQGEYTVQAMIFEPAERTLHLAYGGGKSATEKKLVKLELGGLFDKGIGK